MTLVCKLLQRHNVDIAIITESKIQSHCPSEAYGYKITATISPSIHQGGVALVYRPSSFYHMERTKCFGGNVIRTTLVHANERQNIVGVYIPPREDDGTTLREVDRAMRNIDPEHTILLGDLNVNLHHPRNSRDSDIAETLFSYDFKDISKKFSTRRKKPHTWTWRKIINGQRVHSILD